MRLKQYITEGKKLTDPMIGFGFNYSDIKDVVDYIESELIQENIRYQHPDDYHLSLAIIQGTYDKDELVRTAHSLKLDYKLKPVAIRILRGARVPKDFIVIEYKPNDRFVKEFMEISKEYNTIKFGRITPHISLFTVKKGVIPDSFIKSLNANITLKPVKPTEVQIWNAKHEKEYVKK
jgi:hypothetical protein